MNLIEQQNVLRNLPDEVLSTAMQGGGMPPYLVLTEINRRKQVREHYLSQKQKYDAAQPSVAAQTVQDFAMASRGMMPPDAAPSGGIDAAAAPMDMGAPPAPAGIDAVAPEGFKNGGSVPGYANGTGSAGIPMAVMTGSSLLAPKVPTTARDLSMTPVYSDPYASLREYFASQAGAMDKEREQAQAMALIAAGLGIAGGKSQNFARNLAGALPALEGYQKQMSDIGQQERQFGLERAKLDAQSASEKLAFEQNQPSYKQAQLRQQLIDAGFDPNSEEFKYHLTGLTPPTSAKPVRMTRISGYDPRGNTVTGWADPTTGETQWNVPEGVDPSTVREKSPEKAAADTAELRANVQRDAKLTAAKPKDAAALRDAELKLQETKAAIEGVRKGTNFFTTGLVGSATSGIQGTPAYAQFSAIRTLTSRQALGALDALRATSPTGGALGNVSDADMRLLQSDVAEIDGALDEKTLKERLDIFQDHLENVMSGRRQLYQDTYGEPPPSLSAPSGASSGTTSTDVPWSF